MKQFWAIYKFEFKNYVKNKGFLIVTILLVAAAAVVLSLPRLGEMIGSSDSQAEPVSYTHLDVYKRQLGRQLVKILAGRGLKKEINWQDKNKVPYHGKECRNDIIL